MAEIKQVLITGGAGYVGAVLVPKLIREGFRVKVLDLFMYGEDVLDAVKGNPNLELIKGDIRDTKLLERSLPGCDAVIHLACISNDPSFELDPGLGKSINFDCFEPLVKISKKSGVKRFIYASSSSVYGVKDVKNVTEDLSLEPLTDYSKFKALCEEVLQKERAPGFTTVTIRPATVCGYSPRLRLDLAVNILTNFAQNKREITVLGGSQMRPNIHIEDMTDLYVQLLRLLDAKIDGKIFNAGYENHTVADIASKVRSIVGDDVKVVTKPTDDNRSYHISSEKIQREIGFTAKHSVTEAIQDLVAAFRAGKVPDPLSNIRYFNIKTMQSIKLK